MISAISTFRALLKLNMYINISFSEQIKDGRRQTNFKFYTKNQVYLLSSYLHCLFTIFLKLVKGVSPKYFNLIEEHFVHERTHFKRLAG
jgi:hypothetical protein